MTALLFMLFMALRHCTGSNSEPENIDILMDHVLVVRVPHGEAEPVHVNLTCGEAYDDDSVFWRKDDRASPDLRGNEVTVTVEEMIGGNYSCHLDGPRGRYLNHTLVLVQLEPDNTSVILQRSQHPHHHHGHGGYIQCSGHNYNGSFHCSWRRTADRPEATVVLVKAEQDSKVISCVEDSDGSGVRCNQANCPYEEEKHRISVTVYMRNVFRLEAYTTTFYLRDIVSPEPVDQLRVEADDVFHWAYPATWEKPCRYYGLEFEVKLVHHGENCHSKHIINNQNEKTENTTYMVRVKNKRYGFCVRAKDNSTDGPWSDWSRYDMKKNRHH